MSDQSPVFESPVFPEPDDLDEEVDEDLDDEVDEVDDEGAEDLEDQHDAAGVATGGGRSRAVLEHIVRSLVDDPEAVEIEEREGRGGRVLSLRVAPGDMGRVIGKRGRIAQAMRVVVRAAGASDGSEASVDIVD